MEQQAPDIHYGTQLKEVQEFLIHNTTSRFMIAVYTGIPIQNVYRYIDTLSKSDLCQVVRKNRCKISGMWVEFLSYNPSRWPPDNQLKLFEV